MWEDLYVRRYEAATSDTLPESHAEYRRALEMLYQEVLRFQIVRYGYYSHKSVSRFALDSIKHHGWDELLGNIKYRETEFDKVSHGWRDQMYNEEWEKAETRHQQAMSQWRTIGTDVSELRKTIEETQKDENRKKMLEWLCTIDTSVQYRAARERYSSGTCNWLIEESYVFKKWERESKSFLWLNGKGMTGAGSDVFPPLIQFSWVWEIDSELVRYQMFEGPIRKRPGNRSCVLLLQFWKLGATESICDALITCTTVVCKSPRHTTADQTVQGLHGKGRAT
jgi:hypothetical protein